jgi:hypothetical protein
MPSALLQQLRAAVSAQGATLVIDANLPGCATVAAELSAVCGADAVTLMVASVTPAEAAGNFSVVGACGLFGTASAVEAAFFVSLGPEAVQLVLRVTGTVAGWTLPGQFGVPFLGAATFGGVALAFASSGIAAAQSTYAGDRTFGGASLLPGLNFAGVLPIQGDGWAVLHKVLPQLATLDVVGSIGPPTTAITLHMAQPLSGASFAVTAGLNLDLTALSIDCPLGLGALPWLTIAGSAANQTLPLALALSTTLGGNDGMVAGSFGDGHAASLSDIAALAGLDAGLLSTVLPSDYAESAFGGLRLRDLTLGLRFAPFQVTSVDCTLTTALPWKLIGDSFTVTPILQFHVERRVESGPQGRGNRLQILGMFAIGKTRFLIAGAFPDGWVTATMAAGETLDVGALFTLCLPGIPQPDVTLTGLSFTADYGAGTVFFTIQAASTWTFDLGIAALVLAPRHFGASYAQGAVTAWGFAGGLVFAGLAFDITGAWDRQSGWRLRAQTPTGEGLPVGALFQQLLTEFKSLTDLPLPADIPLGFGDCQIRLLGLDYAAQDKRLALTADVTNVMSFGGLSVEDFAVSFAFQSGQPTTGSALARIALGGLQVVLETAKDASGWTFLGTSAAGEAVNLAALFADLVTLAGLPFPVPTDALLVAELAVAFNDGDHRYFAFSCAVQTGSTTAATDWGWFAGVAQETAGAWTNLVSRLALAAKPVDFPDLTQPIATTLDQLGLDAVSASLPPGTVIPAPAGGEPLTLATLLSHMGWPDELTPPVEPFTLAFADIRLGWDGTDSATTASILLASAWTLGSFTLDDILVRATRTGGKLNLAVSARLLIGQSLVIQAAAIRADGVWSVSGQATDAVNLADALNQIGRHFGIDLGVPDVLAGLDLTLQTLSIAFTDRPGDKTVTFGLSITATISGRALALSLTVAVEQTDGARQAVFTGTVLVGTTVFVLQFDSVGGTSVASQSLLVATLGTAAGLTLQDMLDALPGPAVKAPFSLTIESAFVITGGPKEKTRTLVGLRLADSIDLAVLPIAGGPLAGSALSAMTLLYASAPYTSAELAALAAAWSPVIPPLMDVASARQDLSGGIGFAALLTLPGKATQFLLPGPLPQPAAPARVTRQAAIPTTTAAWHDVGKTFGPVRLDRIGAGYENGSVWLLLDAAMVLGPLELGLQGLGLGFDLHAFAAPDIGLSGMDLALDAGEALSISGSFTRAGDDYLGEARVSAAELSLTAMGGYTPGDSTLAPGDPRREPSVLLFARLDDPLGGPPYAFVTGVSLGFGVNRALVIPPLDGLPAFPLWPTSKTPAIPPPGGNDPAGAVLAGVASRLAVVAPPSAGDSWFAAGVDFTSFGMVKSSALVSVAFGGRLEFALLGISHIQVPQEAENPILYAEIALEARCAPDSGVLTVDGKLTSASYVFMPDCHLSGGFAFYLWFAGPHAGDFVITLGGYHPRFVSPGPRPSYYPDVPRLSLSYRSGDLSVQGTQYIALTPGMLMAGMQMQASWESGPISAWFDAGVDFLLGWQPFHYEAHAWIHLGASFTVDMLLFSCTMTIHIGVDLCAWGPGLGGRVDVDLDIISFSIGFGADQAPPPLLDWDTFRATLLAAPAKPQSGAQRLGALADVPDAGLCTITVARGLRGSPGTARPANPVWAVKDGHLFDFQLDPNDFQLDCKSQLASIACPQAGAAGHTTDLGLLPMGNKPGDFMTTLVVTLSSCGEKDHTDPANYIAFDTLPLGCAAILEPAHAAIYGRDAAALQTQALIPDALMGLRLAPKIYRPSLSLVAGLYDLLFDQSAVPLKRTVSPTLAPAPVHKQARYVDDDGTLSVPFADGESAVCSGLHLSVLTASPAAVLDRRTALIAALHDAGLLADASPPVLDGLAATALWDWPALRALGEEVAA